MTMSGILRRIVNSRQESIDRGDSTPDLPARRPETHPLVPFVRSPFVICEIKRKSPSRGTIAADMNPVDQARLYREQGVRAVSVLTETEHFSGSLNDLMAVKSTFPDLALLRKDFLLSEEDVRVSHRAGADALLLIAAILSPKKLASLYWLTRELGLSALVEVHSPEEIELVRDANIQPELMGINARNLNNFQVDLLAPFRLRRSIDWPCDIVFESGIFAPEQVALAARNGFTGVLVGEAAVKNPGMVGSLGRALTQAQDYPAAGVEFWSKIMKRKQEKIPLVKICGLCNAADARKAVELGADMLGFIFTESPRRAGMALVRELADINVLKVAVLTEAPNEELKAAYEKGLIDAFQYHGSEDPQECLRRGLPFYKALRVRKEEDIPAIMDYPSPRVLVDAWSSHSAGGTGKRLEPELVKATAAHKPLWLAGGLSPENVAAVVREYAPELLDASSALESEPGKKDHARLEAFFKEISRA